MDRLQICPHHYRRCYTSTLPALPSGVMVASDVVTRNLFMRNSTPALKTRGCSAESTAEYRRVPVCPCPGARHSCVRHTATRRGLAEKAMQVSGRQHSTRADRQHLGLPGGRGLFNPCGIWGLPMNPLPWDGRWHAWRLDREKLQGQLGQRYRYSSYRWAVEPTRSPRGLRLCCPIYGHP